MSEIGIPPSVIPDLNPEPHRHLKDVCSAQLDLILKMSETILAKDRQLRLLRQDNQELLNRLSKIEKMTPEPPMEDFEDEVSLRSSTNGINRRKRRGKTSTQDKSVGTGPAPIPINKGTQAQPEQENGILELDLPGEDYLTTAEPYFTLIGEDYVQEEKNSVAEIKNHAEVPGYRTLSFSPSYTMEGTENIEDETFLRRHSKLELDEKRRKKWDIQRMREQRHVEKLRARYDDASGGNVTLNGGSNSTPVLNCLSNFNNLKPDRSLLPQPELATHIMVAEDLPVTAFGYPVPILQKQGFSLPWITD